jgi:hypothetical protein
MARRKPQSPDIIPASPRKVNGEIEILEIRTGISGVLSPDQFFSIPGQAINRFS